MLHLWRVATVKILARPIACKLRFQYFRWKDKQHSHANSEARMMKYHYVIEESRQIKMLASNKALSLKYISWANTISSMPQWRHHAISVLHKFIVIRRCFDMVSRFYLAEIATMMKARRHRRNAPILVSIIILYEIITWWAPPLWCQSQNAYNAASDND